MSIALCSRCAIGPDSILSQPFLDFRLELTHQKAFFVQEVFDLLHGIFTAMELHHIVSAPDRIRLDTTITETELHKAKGEDTT